MFDKSKNGYNMQDYSRSKNWFHCMLFFAANRLVSYPGDEGEDGQLDDSTEMEEDAELPGETIKEEPDTNLSEHSNMSSVQVNYTNLMNLSHLWCEF